MRSVVDVVYRLGGLLLVGTAGPDVEARLTDAGFLVSADPAEPLGSDHRRTGRRPAHRPHRPGRDGRGTAVDGITVAASGGADRTVRLWDLTAGEQIGNPRTFPEPVTALAVAPDGLVGCFGFEVAFLAGRRWYPRGDPAPGGTR